MAAPGDVSHSDPTLQPWRQLLAPLAALAVLAVVGTIVSRGFLSVTWQDGHLSGPLIDVLNRAAPLMLVSLGMMTVIAIRGIDISVGAVVAIAAAVAASIIRSAGETAGHGAIFSAIGGALGVAALCGAWNGLLVVGAGMQPIVATLILMIAGRGVAQLITDGQIITVYYPPFAYLGNGHLLGIPFALVLVLLITVALRLALARTALGLFVRAIGMNPVAAHVAGVRARPIAFGLYVFCGLTAGLAGLIISSNVMSADGNNAGQLLELDAILAVALGGTPLVGGRFTVAGTVLGALVIQMLNTVIYSSGLPPQANLAFKALLVFAAVLLQSAAFRGLLRGLAGRAEAILRACAARRRLDARLLPLVITVSLFVALAVAGSVRYDNFLAPQVFLNLLVDNAFLCIVAVGMTFVILTGGIDLSVGALVSLTTMILASLVQDHAVSPLLAIPLVLAVGALFGLLHGVLIQRFGLQPFIVTLAGMFLARGLAFLISTESISVGHPVYQELAAARIPLGVGSISIGAAVACVVVAAGIWLAHATAFGRTVYAVGGDEAAARLMGLRVDRTVVGVYVLSGFCAALAGVVMTLYMLSGYSLHGSGLELDAIAAVVIGGTLLRGGIGYVAGTFVGVMMLGVIQTLIAFDGTLSSWWTRIVAGALLLAFCLLQRFLEVRDPAK